MASLIVCRKATDIPTIGVHQNTTTCIYVTKLCVIGHLVSVTKLHVSNHLESVTKLHVFNYLASVEKPQAFYYLVSDAKIFDISPRVTLLFSGRQTVGSHSNKGDNCMLSWSMTFYTYDFCITKNRCMIDETHHYDLWSLMLTQLNVIICILHTPETHLFME